MRHSRLRFPVPFLLLAFGLVAGSAPATHAAQGVIDLSWGTCSPVVANVSPTAGPMRLVASQLGNDQLHNAYQVRFQLGAADNTVPDAWRFDMAGCQGSSFLQINHLPSAALAKTCPAFGPGPSIQIKTYQFFPASSGYPTTLMRGLMASTYPAGSTALAGQRYFLAEFVFDHTFSVVGATTPGVSCGGFETPIFVRLLIGPHPTDHSSYLRMVDGVEFPFEPGHTQVTVNSSVPAAQTSWGQIKGAYRH